MASTGPSGFGYGSLFDDKASNEDSDDFVSCTQPELKLGSKRKADKDDGTSSKKKKKSSSDTKARGDSALRQKGLKAYEKMMALQKGIAEQVQVIFAVNDELAKLGAPAVSPFPDKPAKEKTKKTPAATPTDKKKPSSASKKASTPAAKKPAAGGAAAAPAPKKSKSTAKPCELEKELEETVPNESSEESEGESEASSKEEEDDDEE